MSLPTEEDVWNALLVASILTLVVLITICSISYTLGWVR